jgi:cytochrome c-type biogenesis protein CcmH
MTRTARWSFFLVPRKFWRARVRDIRSLSRVGSILQLCLIIGLALSSPARAVEPDEIMADSRLEARARALSVGLRCLVCQNQSIDDSNAPLARDLRLLVRERLKSGESDAEVMRFITDRYGQFVLLNPPVGRNTALLWATPLLLLAAGGAFWWRRRPTVSAAPAASASLSADEQRRLTKLLAKSE